MQLNIKSYNNIFINGMPGSGKSTFARMYATLSGRIFLDFDDFLEKSLNTKIHKIFQKHGEQKFRELEADALRSMKKLNNHVIALGGGTLISKQNYNFVCEHGVLASLVGLPLKVLAARIWQDKQALNVRIRPLFDNCDTIEKIYHKIEKLLAERQEIYENAHVLLRQDLNCIDNLLLKLKQFIVRGKTCDD